MSAGKLITTGKPWNSITRKKGNPKPDPEAVPTAETKGG